MFCATKSWIINSYLQLILDPSSPDRKQDFTFYLDMSLKILQRRQFCGTFLGRTIITLTLSDLQLNRVLSCCDTVSQYKLELQEWVDFKTIDKGNFGSGDRVILQAIEKVQRNVQWVSENLPVISSWLLSEGY